MSDLEKALTALRELVEQIDKGPGECVGLQISTSRLDWLVTFADRVDALRPLITPQPRR